MSVRGRRKVKVTLKVTEGLLGRNADGDDDDGRERLMIAAPGLIL